MNDAYTIKAGETYAITLDHPVSPEQMETMRKHWEEATASKVIFLSGAKLVRTASDADEAVKRVRDLHSSWQAGNGQIICDYCTSLSRDLEPYPCETLSALDGEQP